MKKISVAVVVNFEAYVDKTEEEILKAYSECGRTLFHFQDALDGHPFEYTSQDDILLLANDAEKKKGEAILITEYNTY